MNILLTSVGRRSYLVRYFKEALNGKGKVHVMNSDDSTSAFKEADRAIVSPLIYDSEYIPFLLNYCKKNSIKLLVSLFDIDLPILSKNIKSFEEIGVRLVVSEESIINICNDKWMTYQYLVKQKFNTPKTYIERSTLMEDIAAGVVKFPIVIKPRWGMGSIGVMIADNESELNVLYMKAEKVVRDTYLKYEAKDDIDNCILMQQYIVGEEHGIDIINDLVGQYRTCVIKKKCAMRAGETDSAITISNRKVEQLAERLGKDLKHTGNLDVDIFISKGKIYVLEMNARFGGGYPFSHLAGINLPKALIDWAEGKETDRKNLVYSIGIKGYKEINIVSL